MAGKKGRSGRHRLPSSVKKKNGTYRPSRAAKNEVQVKLGRPDMPDWVARDEEAAVEWGRICPLLEEARVLSDADKAMLADYCSAHSLAVKATRAYLKDGLMPKPKKESRLAMRAHPMIKVAQEARTQAMRLGCEFGLSPSSRSRISSVPKEKGDEVKSDEVPLFGVPKLVVNGR